MVFSAITFLFSWQRKQLSRFPVPAAGIEYFQFRAPAHPMRRARRIWLEAAPCRRQCWRAHRPSPRLRGKSTGGRRSMAKCEKARQWRRDYFDLEMPVSLLRCGGLRMQREAPARRNVGPQFAHVSRGFNSRNSRTRRSRRSGRIALRPETQGIRQLRPLRHEIDKGRETGTEAIAAGVGTTLDAEDPIGGRPSGDIEVIKLAFG